uniref:Uncharacterized protein n=1 Tax=Rhizophora mucronata TaxID=61149 RepID=A0A2P2PX26_RHIMU
MVCFLLSCRGWILGTKWRRWIVEFIYYLLFLSWRVIHLQNSITQIGVKVEIIR